MSVRSSLSMLLATMLAGVLIAGNAVAQVTPITVTNAGFELPAVPTSGNSTPFWNTSGAIVPGAVPGWTPSGPGVKSPSDFGIGDSGVEQAGPHTGIQKMFLNTVDPSVFNTTSHAIVAGRSYKLSFWAVDAYTAADPSDLTASLYYVDGGSRVALGTPQLYSPTSDDWLQYTLTLSAAQVAAGLGKPIGIEFDTTSPNTDESWFGIDDVALENFVPVSVTPIPLTNGDFELPGAETLYWDIAGNIVPGAIPGWQPGGPGFKSNEETGGLGDSGVETGGTAGGAWEGYLSDEDPSIFNLSATNIVAGKGYQAAFDLTNLFTEGGEPTIEVSLFYTSGGNRVVLGAPQILEPGGAYSTFTLSLTAAEAAAGVGSPIGIEFDNITNELFAGSNSYLGIDNVTIGVINQASTDVDLDDDGDVDGNDFLLIQRGLGTTTTSGDVDAWRAAFGSGGAAPAAGAVPEPSSCLLATAAAVMVVCRRRRVRMVGVAIPKSGN